jgi:hypothetical protein
LSAATKRKIAKITADIARIEESFFRASDPDLDQRYHELTRKREHLLRGIVLELHLSIEDIITGAIGNALLQGRLIRSPIGQTLRDLLQDDRPLGFRHKLMLARTLNLVTRKELADLADLNTVRNKCSHTWVLKKLVRRKLKAFQTEEAIVALARHESLQHRGLFGLCQSVRQAPCQALAPSRIGAASSQTGGAS